MGWLRSVLHFGHSASEMNPGQFFSDKSSINPSSERYNSYRVVGLDRTGKDTPACSTDDDAHSEAILLRESNRIDALLEEEADVYDRLWKGLDATTG